MSVRSGRIDSDAVILWAEGHGWFLKHTHESLLCLCTVSGVCGNMGGGTWAAVGGDDGDFTAG